MNIYHGNIIACDSDNTVAEYLVEDKGRIVFIGDTLPKKYSDCKLTDLDNKALIPSFADSHIHYASYSMFSFCPDIRVLKSNREIVAALKEHAKKTKQKYIMGFGASAHRVEEGILISRAELDIVSRSTPVFIVKFDGHACIVNQAMIDILDERFKNLRGYDAETGEMKHEAFYELSSFVTHSISTIDLIKNMQKSFDFLAAKGIGKITTVSGVGFQRDLDVSLELIVGKGISKGFQVRLFFQTMDVEKVVKRHLSKIGGCFATALDGAPPSLDAAFIEPYQGSDNKGVLFYTDDQVIEFCKKANRNGLQIEMHACGDAAFNQATKALKAALDDHPRKDHRHGIIHAFYPTEEGIKICSEYGIQIPTQAVNLDYLAAELGDRIYQTCPFRKFLDANIHLSLSSDGPSTYPDPIRWIYNACNPKVKEHAVTVFEALRMATYYSYWDTFDESDRGSLEVGKVADMVILSESPYEVPITELNRIKVEKLILAGEPYKNQSTNIFILLLKGLLSRKKI